MTDEAKEARRTTSHARRACRGICWWSGFSLLLGALAVPVWLMTGSQWGAHSLGVVTLVLGDWVPSWYEVEAACLLLGVAAFIAAAFIAPRPPGIVWASIREVGLGLIVVLLIPGVLLTGLLGSVDAYTVLPGQSAGGCRIVAQENTWAGGGVVGILQPNAITIEWATGADGISGGFYADDGWRPFTRGTYELTWNDRAATIRLWEGGTGPVGWEPGGQPALHCNR